MPFITAARALALGAKVAVPTLWKAHKVGTIVHAGGGFKEVSMFLVKTKATKEVRQALGDKLLSAGVIHFYDKAAPGERQEAIDATVAILEGGIKVAKNPRLVSKIDMRRGINNVARQMPEAFIPFVRSNVRREALTAVGVPRWVITGVELIL